MIGLKCLVLYGKYAILPYYGSLFVHVAAQTPDDAQCGGTAAAWQQYLALGGIGQRVYAESGGVAVAHFMIEGHVDPMHGVAVVVGHRPVVKHAGEIAYRVDMAVEVDVGISEAKRHDDGIVGHRLKPACRHYRAGADRKSVG